MRSSEELGAIVLSERKQLSLTQLDQAGLGNIGNRLIVDPESGKPTEQLQKGLAAGQPMSRATIALQLGRQDWAAVQGGTRRPEMSPLHRPGRLSTATRTSAETLIRSRCARSTSTAFKPRMLTLTKSWGEALMADEGGQGRFVKSAASRLSCTHLGLQHWPLKSKRLR